MGVAETDMRETEVATQEDNRHWDQIGPEDGKPYLRFRPGMLWPAGMGPSLTKIEGAAERHNTPRWDKWYLDHRGVRLGSDDASRQDDGTWTATYDIPPELEDAPVWELALSMRKDVFVCFGRYEDAERYGAKERRVFRFDPVRGQFYIFLYTYHSEGMDFNPLYIRVDVEGEGGMERKYFVLAAARGDGLISVVLAPQEEEEVPAFLRVSNPGREDIPKGWVFNPNEWVPNPHL